MAKVLFTTRRHYFEDIKAGLKRNEIRRASKHWLAMARTQPSEAVFLCGRLVHRRQVTAVTYVEEGAEKILGRPLSEQGRKDVGYGPVVVFWLGAPMDTCTG